MTFVETSNLSGAALAIRRGNSSWTVERELTLRRLWKAGWSAGEINLELGGTTRNAVIGKLHRFGLTKGDRAEGVEIKCLPGARTAGAKVARSDKPAPPRNRIPPGVRDAFRRAPIKPSCPTYTAPALIAAIERNEAACTFAQLGRDTCRYPYGEPHAADFAFCGRSSEGRTYCSGHARICYQPSAPRRDKVSRR